MNLQRNVNLQQLNTLRLQATADYFCCINNITEAMKVLRFAKNNSLKVQVIGSGSNILLHPQQQNKLFIKWNNDGIRTEACGSEHTLLKVCAGTLWHDLVLYALSKQLSGLENLSLIPGTVGAAPVQNIGAYGSELKDILTRVQAININTLELKEFNNEECGFAYRDSLFKREPEWLISQVTLVLCNDFNKLNLNYTPLKEYIENQSIRAPNALDVSNTVIDMRSRKLPDPDLLANAGSFFKNPIIDIQQAENLRSKYSNLVSFFVDKEQVKISAGWLIEQIGYKGKCFRNVGMYEKQALILVNYGGATFQDIMELTRSIRSQIQKKFSIDLEIEPVLVDCS